MNSNANRPTNHLHCASLFRWIVLAAFFGIAGLSYVYLQIQLHVSGTQRKTLEQDLHELIAENNVMDAQIARLKSHSALQRRLQEGFIKLVPITQQAIVVVHTPSTGQWVAADDTTDNQLRTISHDQAVRR